MNREIEFRALTNTTKGKKWVYGYPYKVKSLLDETNSNWYIRNDHIIDTIVDENTLGQYTGLKDKNGKKIFEGDIVHYKDLDNLGAEKTGSVIYTKELNYSISYYSNLFKSMDTIPLVCLEHPIFTSQKLEVVGNIYENNLESQV